MLELLVNAYLPNEILQTHHSIMISVVVPVYGCKESLKELFERVAQAMQAASLDFELLLVNDACPRGSWREISRLAAIHPQIKGINFSRNFGQHYAITAGLDHAKGEWIVVMDCDLQDMPEEIPALYRKAQEGFDLVVGLRSGRQDSWFRKVASRLFFRILNHLIGANLDHRIGNFGIYSRQVIDAISCMREKNRNFGLFASWVGYKRAELEVQHAKRCHGDSSYTLTKMVAFAFDSVIAYSNKPLRYFVGLGFLFSGISFLFAVWLIIQHLFLDIPAAGWTSVMVSIYFSAGLIIACVGATGLYLGKVFDEVKNRPIYIISDTTFQLPHKSDHK
jgi:glycosyltransferase involved in cell wall biosynthesis